MGKIIGALLGICAIAALALFFGAWVGMVVIGAFASESQWFDYAPGFWETLFGLWSVAILGTTWNGSKITSDKSND